MFEIIVAGTVVATVNTKAEAEVKLNEVRNSFLAMVHPRDTMYIREK